ncbi:MAG: ABC transporter ATP-binding protein [Christensenellaceae bacterium]|nr:ABC transporter ATP-binding protein [Christensenellaceae bacterium]
MLKIEGLHAAYGSTKVLNGIDLDIAEGQIITIVGSNGAGKTTLLSCISGLIPYTGSITFRGESISSNVGSDERVKRGIIQVPEGRQVFAEFSVLNNLKMGAYTLPRNEKIAPMLEEIYKLFPRLNERKNQKAGSLSGGEQQMLALGRALLSKPQLLMLDEPSMGLAPVVVIDIFKTIRKLNERGISILLVEQNAKLALKVADYAYVMENGRISLSGVASEIAEDEKVRAAYLGG